MLPAGAVLGVLAAGALAGVSAGLFGVGGGILLVPAALYLLPGTDFHTAKAVSLVAIIGAAAVGVWTHRREGSVDLAHGALLALGGIFGAAGSALVSERLPDALLTALFGLVLGATGLRLVRAKTPPPRPMRARGRAAYILALGAIAGMISGALGVGGGILLVPGMVLIGISMHVAVGTSLVAVLGNALGATVGHIGLGYGPSLLAIGLPLAASSIPGAYVGARLAHKIHADRLRRLFGAGLLLVALWMLADAWV